MNSFLRLLALLCCFAPAVHAAVPDGDDDLVKSNSFAVSKGGHLEVAVGEGDIRIIPWDKNEVFVKARGIDQEDFDGLKWSLKGNTVVIRNRNSSEWGWSSSSSRVRYEINVPASFNLDLGTSSGEIDIQGAIVGSVRAATSSGDVLLGKVTGSVDLSTSGGDVRSGDIDGALQMKTSGGDIKAGNVTGEVDLSTSGGNIRIGTVKKGLRARTSGGDIMVGDVGSAVSLVTSGGNIDVGKVAGGADLNTAGGDIELGGAAGAVTAKTAGGDLHLYGIRGSVQAKTAGGDVIVELTPDGKAKSRLASAGGNITLYVPEQATATVTARIRVQGSWRRNREEYRIRSDFKGDESTARDDDRAITGSYELNGGGETISLETVNADIQIRKLTGESKKRE